MQVCAALLAVICLVFGCCASAVGTPPALVIVGVRSSLAEHAMIHETKLENGREGGGTLSVTAIARPLGSG